MSPPSLPIAPDVAKLHAIGATDRRIAALLGCSVATVSERRRALGLPPVFRYRGRVDAVIDSTEEVPLRFCDPTGSDLSSEWSVDAASDGLPVDALEHERCRKMVRRAMSSLSPRQEMVLRMRFGIGEKSDHTLEEVGAILGIGKERVRRIESQALRKMRHPARSRDLLQLWDPAIQGRSR